MQTIHYNISDKKALSTPDKPVLVAGESGTSEIVLSSVPAAWEDFEVRALLTTPARKLVDAFAVGSGFLLTNTMLDAQGYLYIEFVAYRGGTEIDRSLPDKLYVNAGRKELGDIDPAPLPDLVAEMVAAKGDCDGAAAAAVLATQNIGTTDADVKAAEVVREEAEGVRVAQAASDHQTAQDDHTQAVVDHTKVDAADTRISSVADFGLETTSVEGNPVFVNTIKSEAITAKIKCLGQTVLIQHSGKNLFNKNNPNIFYGYWNAGTSSPISAYAANVLAYIPCIPGSHYTIQKPVAATTLRVGFASEIPANGVPITGQVEVPAVTPAYAVAPTGSKYLCIMVLRSADGTAGIELGRTIAEHLAVILESLQIEYGDAATIYEDYSGGMYSAPVIDGLAIFSLSAFSGKSILSCYSDGQMSVSYRGRASDVLNMPMDGNSVKRNYEMGACRLYGNVTDSSEKGIGETESPFNYTNDDHSKLYSMYDSLVSAHPEYISRKQLGLSTLGAPIYEYKFSPVRCAYPGQKPYPKMLLGAALHGDENLSVSILYLFAKRICSENNTDQMRCLRNNIIFSIVPLRNPDAYDLKQYDYPAGMNIARNFDYNWDLSSDPKKGPYAASAIETQVQQAYLLANPDAIMSIDCHVRGGRQAVTNSQMAYLSVNTGAPMTIASTTIENMSARWHAKYPAITPPILGFIDSGNNYGYFGAYSQKVAGIPNITWEGFSKSTTLSMVENADVVNANLDYFFELVMNVSKYYQSKYI